MVHIAHMSNNSHNNYKIIYQCSIIDLIAKISIISLHILKVEYYTRIFFGGGGRGGFVKVLFLRHDCSKGLFPPFSKNSDLHT